VRKLSTIFIPTLIIVCLVCSQGLSQNTIGLTIQSEEATPGYTLFAPMQSTQTYLIDNCGYKIMEWSSDVQAGTAAYLMPDGNLVRAGRLPNDKILISGKGGLIEIKDWNDELVWSYTLSDSIFCMHHDLEVMPNGNILAIASEYMSEEQVLLAGRPTAEGEVYNEIIIEIEPNYTTGEATIVWQWSAWDHLVQEVDSTLANFGDVASSASRIDINYYNTAQIQRDWIHINSVAYNSSLDQIVITSRNFEELWIIDHSTTTAEATTSEGGLYGKGGDILYRWGNPIAYKQGTTDDRKIQRPHDAQWVSATDTEGDRILIFNNEYQNGSASAVHIIEVPIDADGTYTDDNAPYGPIDYAYTYTEEGMYSFFASGAELLDNGHLLICDADSGRFIEVDEDDEVIWEYINPVTLSGTVDQGTDPANVSNNAVFKIERYSETYEGLQDRDLTAIEPIEPLSEYDCMILSDIEDVPSSDIVQVYPNPVSNMLILSSVQNIESYTIYNIQGQIVRHQADVDANYAAVEVDQLEPGSYIVQLSLASQIVKQELIIIQ